MLARSIAKYLRISMLLLVAQLAGVTLAHAQGQITITFRGRVMYSTGDPAQGATVTMTTTVIGGTSTQTAAADSGGNFTFQIERDPAQGIACSFRAVSSEIVDDEPLPPSGTISASGGLTGTVGIGDLIIARPTEITLGGVVRDQFNTPVQGLTITMTRAKGNLPPSAITTATTTTDAAGHYQFTTFGRCNVVEEFKASIGNYFFQGGTSISGCVLNSNDSLDFSINMGSNLQNAGVAPCNTRVPRPVNVTNGNMYLQQTDYHLPAPGEAIVVTRTYNSISQDIGLFGRGWSTVYDEIATTNANGQLQLTMTDGRLVTPLTPDFYGQIVGNSDGTSTVTFKDGAVHQFNSAGKLLSLSDRNGNRTLLTYANGKLASITDSFNRILTVTTNTAGLTSALSDSLGPIATYTYGGSDELLSVTYADNSRYQYSYTTVPGGLALASVVDGLGNTIEQHDYDSQGRATTSQTHGGAEKYTLNYISGTETDVTDALGHITKYFYSNIKGRRVVTRVEGLCSCGGGSQTQSWTYDDRANVNSHTNASGQTSTYTYDANGNELSATSVLGSSSFTHNQFGEALTAIDAMGAVTANTYDVAGNLLSVTDALNNTTTLTYDNRGKLLTMTNARGKVTSLAYDSSGNISQATDALGGITKFSYDTRGRLITATDALNNVTTYAYDPAGRVNKITRPDLSFVTFTYDLAGRRTKFTDALNNSTSFAYDGAYRLITVTDAALESVNYTYDLMSNLIGATDQLGRTTNINYDEFRRPIKTLYPPAVVGATRLQETVEYDSLGNITKRTDAAGRVTSFAYDNANRLVAITDPLLQVTAYEYNARSNMIALVDALGQRYTFDYDALSRVIAMTRAGIRMSVAYDAVGNRVQRTDYNNMSTAYAYDALNRLTKITYPDATIASYGYTRLSQLATATNINGTVSFTYDNVGRVTSTTDVWGELINYSYDANDRRTGTSLGTSTLASYTYDTLNRLTKITDSGRKTTGYAYDVTGKVTSRTLPNNVVTSYSYDGLDRLTQLIDKKKNKLIANNQYSYNNAGEIIQNIDQSGTHTYGYDALDRLTSASYPATGNETYAYDAVGNRTTSQRSSTYTYQPFNRLTGTTGASYLYDNNGNMIAKTESAGTTQFAWDFENRLVQAATATSGSVTYKYDALGRRIQSAPSSGASTNFTYDGQDVVQDKTSAGTITEYLNGPGIDNKIRQKTGNTLYYFAQDHLGSTTALTDSKGALVERETYDAYGNSAGSALTRYGYTGRERDSLTGLQYNRARFYDPQLGRFISEDPIGISGGINQFAYVRNNPQNAKDPSGLYEEDVHYYLTYYMALKAGCNDAEARAIASGNQGVDESPLTAPGPGWKKSSSDPTGYLDWTEPDYRQQQINADHHALHPGSHAPYLAKLWADATNGAGNLMKLGSYLHYLQDIFSHAGYENPLYGHGTGLHGPDKTANDVEKAMLMAQATWDSIRAFGGKNRCHCQGSSSGPDWPRVRRFLEASGGPNWREINPAELDVKRRILDVPLR